MDDFISHLEKYQIKYTKLRLDKWLDFCLLKCNKNGASEQDMINFFDLCNPPFRGLHNRRMYFCHLSASAEQADLYTSDPSDYFDLTQSDEDVKKRLLEFNFGFSKKGYAKLCRQCAGCDAVNHLEVDGAIQISSGGK